MANKPRSPLQVSDKFLLRLKELQRKIMMSSGEKKSFRELTEYADFSQAEQRLLKKSSANMVDLNIRFDGRLFK